MKRVDATVVAIALLLSACATVVRPVDETGDGYSTEAPPYALRLIGEQRLAHRLVFAGTTVGGLSGIDHDPDEDLYYLASDDRSVFAPTRFYTARLAIDETGFHRAELRSVVFLARPDGAFYGRDEADAEAIRFDRWTRSLWWTSEGLRRIDRKNGSRLIDPFVRHSALDGSHLGEATLDPMFHIVDAARGPRDNLVFEGATLSVDGRSLWVAMEAPLIEDGAPPTMTEGAWVRITRYDRDLATAQDFRTPSGQFAYRVDPVPSNGAWTSAYAQNGVSEILALDAMHLLVMERALVLGAGWRIRLFDAAFDAATDVASLSSLASLEPGTAPVFTPMRKRLVLDFDVLHVHIDNLEGLCFGPVLANGHRTLVLVADDNFNSLQTTQLLAFEIVPR